MANFKLTQTGEQIQADLDLLDKNSATQGQVLTANGTGGASWQNAQGGTEVVANPSLSGTESELTGLKVAGTKYKVPQGGGGGSGGVGNLYLHNVFVTSSSNDSIYFRFAIYSSSQEAVTIAYLRNYITQHAYSGLCVYGYIYLPTTDNAERCLPIVSIVTGADDNEAIVVEYYNSSAETTSPYPFAANSTCDDLVSQI